VNRKLKYTLVIAVVLLISFYIKMVTFMKDVRINEHGYDLYSYSAESTHRSEANMFISHWTRECWEKGEPVAIKKNTLKFILQDSCSRLKDKFKLSDSLNKFLSENVVVHNAENDIFEVDISWDRVRRDGVVYKDRYVLSCTKNRSCNMVENIELYCAKERSHSAFCLSEKSYNIFDVSSIVRSISNFFRHYLYYTINLF